MTLPGGRQNADRATATGVLKTVRRRPRWAALMVPVAAGAAVVTSATLVTATGNDDGQVVAETSEVQTVDYQQSEAIAVGEDEQDFSAFAAGASGVGAQAAPEAPKTTAPSKANTSDSGKGKQSGGSSSGDGGDASQGDGSGDVSNEACGVSSGIESGLADNARKVYRAVCANYPQVKSYGGRRNDPGSDHNTGHAVDVMIRGSVGDDITAFLIKNRAELGITYVIWEQKIYAPYTGWKGRPMENRGSDTANHFDHVHVSVS